MELVMELRLIRQTEIEQVVNLLSQVFGEEIRNLAQQELNRMFTTERYPPQFLGAFDCDNFLGVCAVVQIIFCTDTYGLCWLAVRSELQRQGIGTSLVDAVMKYTEEELLRGKPGTMLLACFPELTQYYIERGFHAGIPMHEDSVTMSHVLNS
jgi:ribosomal protein S18 acetylase RimI-like enzyme